MSSEPLLGYRESNTRRGIPRCGISFGIVAGFACCSLLIVGNFIIYDPSPPCEKVSKSPSKVCETKECVQTAQDFLKNTNKSADPCDDFYEYACGKFSIHHPILKGKSRVTSFSIAEDEVRNAIKELLESKTDINTPCFVKSTRTVYKTCMNIEAINERGFDPLIKDLEELGGWPVLNTSNWNGDTFNWADLLVKLRQKGLIHHILTSINVDVDAKNHTRNIIQVGQPSFGLPDRAYLLKGLNDSIVQLYYATMVNVSVAIGVEQKSAEQQMLDVLKFEMKLAEIALSAVDLRNVSLTYNLKDCRHLYELAPTIPWRKLLDNIVETTVQDTDEINVLTVKYFESLGQILDKENKTVIANYMLWRVVLSALPTLGQIGRRAHFKLTEATTGEGQQERWEECISITTKNLFEAISSMFVQKYPTEGQSEIDSMVENVQNALFGQMDSTDWMDKVTATRAKRKLSSMIKHLGFPKELADNKVMEEFHRGVTVNNSDYYGNVKALRRWRADKGYQKLRETVNRDDWQEWAYAAIINAFYSPNKNSITLPTGILRYPFFGARRTHYLNYGEIGWVAAHEITHGFDDQGRQFDENGDNVDWWTASASVKYEKRVNCVADQYSSFWLPEVGLHIDGRLTLGENIADNGGIKLAFEAYQKLVEEIGSEATLPRFENYTVNQLFFISAANIWCANEKKEFLQYQITTNPHSPSRFRVNGPLANFDQFAVAFNCKPGSNMNPTHKCQVW